mmetsp:Transcript_834/g.3246  ORF Transcript_834/g.3246 Transcript_834/m.3246 type:complete len:431 (-) Transcript_834:248-1540(-)
MAPQPRPRGVRPRLPRDREGAQGSAGPGGPGPPAGRAQLVPRPVLGRRGPGRLLRPHGVEPAGRSAHLHGHHGAVDHGRPPRVPRRLLARADHGGALPPPLLRARPLPPHLRLARLDGAGGVGRRAQQDPPLHARRDRRPRPRGAQLPAGARGQLRPGHHEVPRGGLPDGHLEVVLLRAQHPQGALRVGEGPRREARRGAPPAVHHRRPAHHCHLRVRGALPGARAPRRRDGQVHAAVHGHAVHGDPRRRRRRRLALRGRRRWRGRRPARAAQHGGRRGAHQHPLLRDHRHQPRGQRHLPLRHPRQGQDWRVLPARHHRLGQLLHGRQGQRGRLVQARRRSRQRPGLHAGLAQLPDRAPHVRQPLHALVPEGAAQGQGALREARRALRAAERLQAPASERGRHGGQDGHDPVGVGQVRCPQEPQAKRSKA